LRYLLGFTVFCAWQLGMIASTQWFLRLMMNHVLAYCQTNTLDRWHLGTSMIFCIETRKRSVGMLSTRIRSTVETIMQMPTFLTMKRYCWQTRIHKKRLLSKAEDTETSHARPSMTVLMFEQWRLSRLSKRVI
jgi:hypothetical protein